MRKLFILLLFFGIILPQSGLFAQAQLQYQVIDIEYNYSLRLEGVHHVAEAKSAIAVIHTMFGVMPVFYQNTGEIQWTSRKNKTQNEIQNQLDEHGFSIAEWKKKFISNDPIEQKEE